MNTGNINGKKKKPLQTLMKKVYRKKAWNRVVTSVAAAVVFVTTYMLILPAITMTRNPICGLEEHTHTQECYTEVYVPVLDCPYADDSGGFVETAFPEAGLTEITIDPDAQKQRQDVIILHRHDENCFDADGILICTLPEREAHVHTPECYAQSIAQTAAEPAAEPLFVDGTEEIFTDIESGAENVTGGADAGGLFGVEIFTSDADASDGQESGDAGQASSDPEAMQTNPGSKAVQTISGSEAVQTIPGSDAVQIISGREQESVQEQQLICGREELIPHVHTEECYDVFGNLICTLPQVIVHQHTQDECFRLESAGLQLTCTLPEHVHTDECYPNPQNSEGEEPQNATAGTVPGHSVDEDGTIVIGGEETESAPDEENQDGKKESGDEGLIVIGAEEEGEAGSAGRTEQDSSVVADELSDAVTEPVSEHVTEPVSEEVSEEVLTEKIYEMTVSQVTEAVFPETVTEVPEEIVPETAAEITTEMASEMTTELIPVTTTEISSEITSEEGIVEETEAATTEMTTEESSRETGAEETTKPVVEAGIEETSETAVETATEEASETTTEAAIEGTTEMAVETSTEEMSETAAETSMEEISEAATEETSEAATYSVVENISEVTTKTSAEVSSVAAELSTTEEESSENNIEENAKKTGSGKLEYTANGYTVRVNYDAKSGIPEGASLLAEEILPDQPEYEIYRQQALLAIRAEENEDLPADQARFFNIMILDCDGKVIDPAGTVTVDIICETAMTGTENEGTVPSVIRFDDDKNGMILPPAEHHEVQNDSMAEEEAESAEALSEPLAEPMPRELPGMNSMRLFSRLLVPGGKSALMAGAQDSLALANSLSSQDSSALQAGFTAQGTLVESEDDRMENLQEDTGEEEKADETTVSFNMYSSSVYGIVGTVIEKTVLASDGKNYHITVTCGVDSGISEGAELEVFELTGTAFENLVPQLECVLESVSMSAGYARLFDISIVRDGEKLQPAAPVSVQITVEDIDVVENPIIVHFGEKSQIVDVVADGQIVSFMAESFSIYAVVDETKRLKYIFHNGNKVVATEYVKEGESLYDPGIEVDYGQTFIGWALSPNETNEDNIYTIGELNQKLSSETEWDSVTDLQEVDVYAITKDAYYLRYMTVDDHGNEIVLKTVSVRTDQTDKTVRIDYDFTGEEGQTFEGWIDVSDGTLYQLGQSLTLDHHIDLYSKIHGRNWLVFDANAGGPGSGVTYTPPQLLIGEATTTRPSNPTRKGYSFQGWYTNPQGTGTPFEFGNTISEDTVLYAKWTPDNTDYYVIFWRQKASDAAGLPDDQKQYDYIESVKRSALTDSNAELQNSDKTKRTGDYLNCTFNEARSDVRKTVNADGTTILNVYYDRYEYTLTFQVNEPHYEYTPTTGNNGTQYGLVNGEYVQLTRSGSTWTYPTGGVTYTPTTSNDGVQYGFVNGEYVELTNFFGNWYYRYTRYNGPRYIRTEQTETYTGTRYTRAYVDWTTIHTITALYDSDIHDKWSFTGSNGVVYPTTLPNTSWTPVNSSTYTARITSMQRMPGENIIFHWTSSNNTTRYFHYYVEALPDDTDTRSFNGTDYALRLEQPNDFNIVYYNDDFWLLEGFTRQAIAKSNNQVVNLSAGGNINWTALNNSYGGADNHLYFYYTRNKYTIHYISPQGPNTTERLEKQDDHVYYEASLAPYGLQEDGSWYYEPTNGKDGYFFAGWYEDESYMVPYDFNTQMPANNVTVYAKWDTQRVRVVLVPTKDNAHNDDVQMANNQSLTFRLDYKEPVSDENIKSGVIKRTGYRLVGWYTSPTFEEDTLWNFSTEVSKEVPAVDMDYQSSTNTDWVNNTYGDNDGAHDNVRGILKLYAKWELTVDENSVYIEYDVPEEYCTYDSQGNLQTTIPVDETAYVLTDQNITTTIKEAPTNYADGFIFAGWQLLNADGSEASDVNPFTAGDTQTIDQTYIEERTITDDFGNTATIKVIHLKAKFDIDEENVATMVTFDGNGGVTNDTAQDDRVTKAVQVNKTFSIPGTGEFVCEGYTQVGWSFDSTTTAENFRILIEQNTNSGTVDYDTLAHLGIFEMGQTVAADNKFLTEINNWEPLGNTIYAVWEINTYTVTVKKVVDGETTTDKDFSFTASASDDYTISDENASFKLVNGGEKLLTEVPYGTVLTFSETPASGYSIQSVDAKQTTNPDKTSLEEEKYIDLEGADGKSYTIKGDTVITYTNEKVKEKKLRIHKIGDDAESGLAGAEFRLTSTDVDGFSELDRTSLNGDTVPANLGYLPGNDENDTTLFVLPIGNYTLEETTPPPDYKGLELENGLSINVGENGITIPSTDNVSLSTDDEGIYTLTVLNTKKTSITAKKVWYASRTDNTAPVVIKLKRDLGQGTEEEDVAVFTLTSSDNWTRVISDLPMSVMKEGVTKPYRYYLEEQGLHFGGDENFVTVPVANYENYDLDPPRYFASSDNILTQNGWNGMNSDNKHFTLSQAGTLFVANRPKTLGAQMDIRKKWKGLASSGNYGWEDIGVNDSRLSDLSITVKVSRIATYEKDNIQTSKTDDLGTITYDGTNVTNNTTGLYVRYDEAWHITIPEANDVNDGMRQLPRKGLYYDGTGYYDAVFSYNLEETGVTRNGNDVTDEWDFGADVKTGGEGTDTQITQIYLFNYEKYDLTIIKKWIINDLALTNDVNVIYFTVKRTVEGAEGETDIGKLIYEKPTAYGLKAADVDMIQLNESTYYVIKMIPEGEAGSWNTEQNKVIDNLCASLNTYPGMESGNQSDHWPEASYTVTELAYKDAEGIKSMASLCTPTYYNKVRKGEFELKGGPEPVQLGYDGDSKVQVVNTLGYEVNIYKTDEGLRALANAHFALYSEDSFEEDGVTKKDGAEPVSGKGDLISDADGNIALGMLDKGTYYLLETAAPNGYLLLTRPVKIIIDPTSISTKQEGEGDSAVIWPLYAKYSLYSLEGTESSLSSSQDGINVKQKNQDGITSYSYTFTVTNTTGVSLPNTGGPGTNLIYLLGIMLTGLAGSGLVMKKRRRAA